MIVNKVLVRPVFRAESHHYYSDLLPDETVDRLNTLAGQFADGRRARDWAATNRAAREFSALFFGSKW